MRYVGSKKRLTKYLIPILTKCRSINQLYIEPFAGSFSVISQLDGPRWGNDSNPYLISLYRAVRSGWIPPNNVSEEEYYRIRDNKHLYKPELVGFVGFACSFAAKWFGGYAKGYNSGIARNYANEGCKSLIKQAQALQNIRMTCYDYIDLKIPNNSLVYCDPPYYNTTKYKHGIDYSIFWDWCRNLSFNGCTVFISSYQAPLDYVSIFEKEQVSSLDLDTGSKRNTEKLYVWGKTYKNSKTH